MSLDASSSLERKKKRSTKKKSEAWQYHTRFVTPRKDLRERLQGKKVPFLTPSILRRAIPSLSLSLSLSLVSLVFLLGVAFDSGQEVVGNGRRLLLIETGRTGAEADDRFWAGFQVRLCYVLLVFFVVFDVDDSW